MGACKYSIETEIWIYQWSDNAEGWEHGVAGSIGGKKEVKIIKVHAEGITEKEIAEIKKFVGRLNQRAKKNKEELKYEMFLNGRMYIQRKYMEK